MNSLLKLFIVLSLFQCFACSHPSGSSEKKIISDTIRIKGSDTEYEMVKHLAKAYMAEHPEVIILVEGGGSNKGIAALIDHKIDICNSSREIREPEMKGSFKAGDKPKPIMFATDALAIITNYELGIDSLSTTEISKLFKGEIKNWKEVHGPDKPVVLYGRDRASGTSDYFREKFMENVFNPEMHEKSTNAEVLNSVIRDKSGVGYVSTGFLLDSLGKPNGKVWAVPVYIENHQAVSPYELARVKKGEYIITRPLYQYIAQNPDTHVQDFILFELTRRGQDIIFSHGFFPINDYQTQINRLKGLMVE